MILKFASPSSVSSIFDMEEIQTEIGKVSVFGCVFVYHIIFYFDIGHSVCMVYTKVMQIVKSVGK